MPLIGSAPPSRFEQALLELAPFVGADGDRPEKEEGEGPDNLLEWPQMSLVIEAKNEARYAEIPKKDAEQLLHSMRWFAKTRTGQNPKPVMIGPATKTAKGVHMPDGARVMTPEHLSGLLEAISGSLGALVAKPPSQWEVEQVLELLVARQLTPDQFIASYTCAVR